MCRGLGVMLSWYYVDNGMCRGLGVITSWDSGMHRGFSVMGSWYKDSGMCRRFGVMVSRYVTVVCVMDLELWHPGM